MKVVKTKGTMITAKNGDNTISRFSSFFKKLRLTVPEDESDTIDTPSVIEHPQKHPNHSDANVPDPIPSTPEVPAGDGDQRPKDLKMTTIPIKILYQMFPGST